MSRKLVFLPCLPGTRPRSGDWANGLARDGLEPRRIPAALPFLAVVGDGPACTYTVEPAHGAKRDGCRVPWVGSRIVRGRPAGKYPYGGGAAPRAEPKLLAFAFLQLRACRDNYRYIRRSELSERRGRVFNIGLSDVHNEPYFHARLNNRHYKLHCPDHPREIQPRLPDGVCAHIHIRLAVGNFPHIHVYSYADMKKSRS